MKIKKILTTILSALCVCLVGGAFAACEDLPIVGKYFNTFYKTCLPFELTNAQKRVIREIQSDIKSGKQMNRLLQGDVGSGKTMVALLTALLAIDNGYQVCIMAPTEILANQHYEGITQLLSTLNSQLSPKVALLTGSTTAKQRQPIHEGLLNGEINLLIGTHALIEDAVTFADTGVHYREGEETGGILYYESSRGCPYSCAYCLSSATHGVRFKSVEQTLDELLEFERIHAKCKVIKFVDRTFNADVKRANAIWRALLDEKYTKSYHFEICATLLNEESFDILSHFPKGGNRIERNEESHGASAGIRTGGFLSPPGRSNCIRCGDGRSSSSH